MRFNRKPETTFKAWVFRALLGPAMLLDGILATITIGTLSFAFTLSIARSLSNARYKQVKY